MTFEPDEPNWMLKLRLDVQVHLGCTPKKFNVLVDNSEEHGAEAPPAPCSAGASKTTRITDNRRVADSIPGGLKKTKPR